jgi:EAL domain-containing protein (putative c-di-GMP-specific phosphodiesterase class I)
MNKQPKNDLRVERDRFVAFAFCDADILLELDHAQAVVFAAGATVALVGRQPEALVGADIFEIVLEDHHAALRELMRMAEGGNRIEPVIVRLRGEAGETPPLALTGFQLPDMEGHFFLALRMGLPAIAPAPEFSSDRVPASGVFDRESFTEVAGQRIKAIRQSNESYHYSVFQLGGFSDLRARLDEERHARLMETIGASLRRDSLHGDTAGQVSDEGFGLIHDAGTDMSGLRHEIEQSTREVDPESRGVKARVTSLDLDTEGMSEADAYRALAYTINRSSAVDDRAVPGTLSKQLAALVEDTAQEMAEARAAIEADSFEVLYQPVVDLDTGARHHFEVLSRFGDASPARSPSEFFQFAGEVGLVRDLDLACCRRAIATLRKSKADARLSINLSSNSLRNEAFANALVSLLDDCRDIADRLFFDITEDAIASHQVLTIRLIAELRRRKHKICIDNFGAGASIMHYLRDIEIDMVKIDSAYIGSVMALANGEVFLRSMSELCEGLGIVAIASMIEDQSSIRTVRKVGIKYAQGYLFGKPAKTLEIKEPEFA